MDATLKPQRTIADLRYWARSRFFGFLRHLASIDDTREIFGDLLRLQNSACVVPELAAYRGDDHPYPELRQARTQAEARRTHGADVVFITARFRTGSTMLWNLFRQLKGVTAYYEPFNERRWFDPRTRGTHTDRTHVDVADYWSEYDGLEFLDEWYSQDWRYRQLYMPTHAHNPPMEKFIDALIERAPGRPVLQFNEVDLRLPWLRARFPQAKLLHLYRNPRDQWCSTLGAATVDMRTLNIRNFAAIDGFYLLGWGRDLRHYFPFLTLDGDAHPYELFYQIWKLSYLFGARHADLSISFEELTARPAAILPLVLKTFAFEEADAASLLGKIGTANSGKWKSHGCDDLYVAIEERVDAVFAQQCAALKAS